MKNFVAVIIFLGFISGCSSSTESGEVGANRSQFLLLPSSYIENSAASGYQKTIETARSKGQLDRNPSQVDRVRTVAKRLIPHTANFRAEAPRWDWQTHVITSDEINAWCMPGGKIAFYSGIIEKLQLTDGEIAAIMGHEIAHALREHGRERMSQELVKVLGIQILEQTGKINSETAEAAMIVSSLAISLPNSRGQESEADRIGMELMARAGYNPNEAVTLWRKMQSAGGKKNLEFLSTHPSDSTRIENLERLAPQLMHLYTKAR
jgi:predicted Zn-dependent protease